MTSAIFNVVINAYNAGLLQYDPMSICGLTISMAMRRNFNLLTINYCGITRCVNLWDADSEFSTEAAIESMIAEILELAGK